MKLILLQENLEKALSLINRTANLKTQLPITTNALIKTKNGEIEITATDLENTTRITIEGKVEKEGGILLPTKTLTEVVAALPKEQVVIETEGLSAEVRSSKHKAKINGISPSEFPEPQEEKGEQKVAIDSILRNIKTVVFASSSDESRAVLTGILIRFTEEGMLIVATDGYRLSLKKIAEKTKTQELQNLIIPARILGEIAKIAKEREKQNGETEGILSIGGAKNQAIFSLPGIKFFTRLIEGEYPAFEKIIPQSNSTQAIFDKDEFLSAVRLSSVFAREGANIIKLTLSRKGITLSANAPQVGENRCEIEGNLKGEENEIAFNSRFLLDFLANVDTKEISFEMTGPLNPGVFKIPGDNSYLHIIMPVRVQQ